MRAVTTRAGGRARGAHRVAYAVDTGRVGLGLFFMAAGTVGRRQLALMHQVFDARVAIHTIEHGMDGFLKGVGRKKQWNDFPVHLAGCGRVQVAVEAVRIGQLGDGVGGRQSWRCERQAEHDEKAGEDST